MTITIITEINSNSRVPQWLQEAVRNAERAGSTIKITTKRCNGKQGKNG
jgi:hypothetical protein